MKKYERFIDYEHAKGEVPYRMTNNYLFIAVLQDDKFALRGLIAALLHRKIDEIRDIEILNPIELGAEINLKDYILDIKLMFNDDSIMNLEMQVINRGNWVPRSISYLCREWDRLEKGADYEMACNAYHIGFLDFSLFEDHPGFYTTYRLRDTQGYEYSDKFNLSVIELNHIEMATDDDKLYGIDKWAKLFKAGTWEDIKMLAKNDECIDSAARGMFIKTQNDDVLKWCRKMDEEIAGDRRREQRMAEMTKKIEELEIIQRDAESKLVDTESKLVDTESKLVDTETKLVDAETKLVDAENQCTALARENCELAARIAELEQQLAEQNK